MKQQKTLAALFLALLMLQLPLIDAISISNLQVAPTANTSAVSWTTDVPGTSVVKFGIHGLTSQQNNQSLVLSHSLTLSSLLPFTQYQFFVESVDANGARVNSSGTFTTLHTPPPGQVTGVVLNGTTFTTLTLSWNALPDTDLDVYRIYRNNVYLSNVSASIRTFTDTNLASGTTFLYQIAAFDKDFNEGAKSAPLFATTAAPDTVAPTITNISIQKTSGTVVSWNTNEAASSFVHYGTTTALNNVAGNNASTTTHNVPLTNLTNGQQYSFKVRSCDAAGNCAESAISSFKAGLDVMPPSLEVIAPTSTNKATVDISGTTEANSFTQIFVGSLVKGTVTKVPSDGKFVFRNVPLSSGMNSLRVVSRDEAENTVEKKFTIFVDARPPHLEISFTKNVSRNSEIQINGTVDENVTLRFYVHDANSAIEPKRVEGLKFSDEQLSWIAQDADNVSFYIVYRDDVGAIAKTTSPSFRDTHIVADTQYVYRVSAMSHHCVEGVRSDPVRVSVNKTMDATAVSAITITCDEPAETSKDLVTENGMAAFSEIIPLSEGNSRVTVEATDLAGNKATEQFTVLSDNSAPRFENLNLRSLSPSYLCQETIRGNTDEPATILIFLGDDSEPTISMPTGEGNTFEIPLTLRKDASMEVEVGGASANSLDTASKVTLSDKAWDNRVRIVARDAVGNEVVEEDVIRCAMCGFGTDWQITTSNPMPNELTPQLIMEGFGQIGLTYNLTWQGLGNAPSIHQIEVDFPPLSDDGKQRYDEEWIRKPILVFKSENPALGYVQINVKRNDPIGAGNNETDPTYYERELNLSKNHIGECDLPNTGCLKLPLMMTIEYGEASKDGTGGLQKQCWDTQIFIQPPAINPDDIPKTFLNSSIKAIDAALEVLNTTLAITEPVTKYATIGCIGSMVLTWGKYFSDFFSCTGVKEEECQCDPVTGECDTTECESCYAARKSTKQLEDAQHYLCDRVFCPAVPTYESYAQAHAKDKKSNCFDYKVSSLSALEDYENYDSCDTLGIPPLSQPDRNCCLAEYNARWKSGILLSDEMKMSKCLTLKDAGKEDTDEYRELCGGLTETFSSIADFSLCASNEGKNLQYVSGRINDTKVSAKEYAVDVKMKRAWDVTAENRGEINRTTGELNTVKTYVEVIAELEQRVPDFTTEHCTNAEAVKKVPAGVRQLVCAGVGNTKFVANPASGLLRSIQAVCLSAISAYLRHYQQILQLIKACFQTILYTGQGSAGVCQAVLSNYICDLVYELIRCIQDPATEGAGTDYEGISGVFKALSYATASVKQSVSDRYGQSNLYNVLFVQKKLIHSVCLAAFTGDWNLDWDALVQQAAKIPIDSTVAIGPANRRFISFNPTTGRATHIYEVGVVIVAGSELDYRVNLVCSNSFGCNHADVPDGSCDCRSAGKEKLLDVTHRFTGNNHLIQGQVLNDAPLIEVNAKDLTASDVRYDKVRVEYTYKNNAGEKVTQTVEQPISLVGGDPPASCVFKNVVGFMCQVFTDANGVAFFAKQPVPVYSNTHVQSATGGYFSVGERIKLETEIAVLPGTDAEADNRKFARIEVLNQHGAPVFSEKYYELSAITSDKNRFIPEEFVIKKEHFNVKLGVRQSCTELAVNGKTPLDISEAYNSAGVAQAVKIVKTAEKYAICRIDVPQLGSPKPTSLSSEPICKDAPLEVLPSDSTFLYGSTLRIHLPTNTRAIPTEGSTTVIACEPAQTVSTSDDCPKTAVKWNVRFSLHSGSGKENKDPQRTPEYYQSTAQSVEIPVTVHCQEGGTEALCPSDNTAPLSSICLCPASGGFEQCNLGGYCCPSTSANPGCSYGKNCAGEEVDSLFEAESDESDVTDTHGTPGGAPQLMNLQCVENPVKGSRFGYKAAKDAAFGKVEFASDFKTIINDGVGPNLVEMTFMGHTYSISENSRGIKVGGVNKKVYGAFKCVEQEILKTCDDTGKNYKIVSTNTRRGANSRDLAALKDPQTKEPKPAFSNHVYGIAIDINPKTNPDCRDAGHNCNFDIPMCWVRAFQKYGFRWLGDKEHGADNNIRDYMHFDFQGDLSKVISYEAATGGAVIPSTTSPVQTGATSTGLAPVSSPNVQKTECSFTEDFLGSFTLGSNKVFVWVPKEARCGGSYPFIYLLHGIVNSDGWSSMLGTQDFVNAQMGTTSFTKSTLSLESSARRLLNEGKIQPAILIAPADPKTSSSDLFSSLTFRDLHTSVQNSLTLGQMFMFQATISPSSVSAIAFSGSTCRGSALPRFVDEAKAATIPLYLVGLADGTCGSDYGGHIASKLQGTSSILLLETRNDVESLNSIAGSSAVNLPCTNTADFSSCKKNGAQNWYAYQLKVGTHYTVPKHLLEDAFGAFFAK